MARRARIVSANDDRAKLIDALRFASIATKDEDGKTSFVAIADGQLRAYNETFTIGAPVDVALDLCPQADKFAAAMQQCGGEFKLTQMDTSGVSIRSGAFRALVGAIPHDMLDPMQPDPPCAIIGEPLRDAITACLRVMTGKGDRLINTALLLRANSMTATNGAVAIEYWHGIDLPGPMNIPKKTAETLAKHITKPFARFGFSPNSATFWFDDMSFLKTRLLAGEYPNVDRLFANVRSGFIPVWPMLFTGLKAIKSFVEDDRVFFHSGHVATHQSLDLGASYQVDGLPSHGCYNPALWWQIEPFVKQVALGATTSEPAAFVGDYVRGLLMGKT